MKIKFIKLISTVLVINLLVACSNKNDSISYNNDNIKNKEEKINKTIDKANDKSDNIIDKNLSQIKSFDSNIGDNNLGVIDRNSYMNKITSNVNGQRITLTSIHFGFDNYLMRDEMLPIVRENSIKISSVIDSNSNIKVKLEGNCDEWGTDEYNFALGLKRAKTVKDALINNGIKSSDIIVVSLGESNPRCSDQTSICWKQNRRVDHLILQ